MIPAVRGGNYVPLVLRAALELQAAAGYRVTVKHDSWCALLAGTGPCDCSPEIVVRSDELDETA